MINGSTHLNKHKLNIYQSFVGKFENLALARVQRRDEPVLMPVDILSVDSKSSSVLDFPRWKSSVFPTNPKITDWSGLDDSRTQGVVGHANQIISQFSPFQ
jgi:hypothetical protein